MQSYHQKLLSKNFGKYNLVAKSRQLGVTSFALAYSLYLTHTEPDTVCMIMSYSFDTVDIVFKKLKAMYDDLNPAVKIKDVANNRKELELENRSRIICCVCGSKDAARGSTLRYVHLTEVAFMDDEKLKNQLIAIEAALSPNGQMVLESTSNGMNMWFELWMKAVNKESQYKPFFFSWLDDKYLFLKAYQEDSEIYKNRNGRYLTVEDLDEEELALYYKMDGENNPLALLKLMWRRMRIANIGLEKFRQEFPSNAMESFIVSGNNIFDLQSVQSRLNYVDDTPKLELPNKLAPVFRKWKNSITIWKYPKAGKKYYGGVDTGEGIGSDNSVITIVDEDGFQCMEFANNKIKPYAFAELVREIGKYYNTCLLVVEKLSAGHTVVDKLYDSNNRYINLYKYRSYDAKGKMRKKPGFETSAKSRPIIINRFVEARPNFEFKGKTFETAKIILQTLRSIIRFHTGYICSNPVSLTGDKELVSFLNKVYKKGSYNKTDMEVARELVSYGDAFEYVYLDENDIIRSKIIRNKDSYPVYDGHGTYTNFVEYWKDEETREDNYVVYYPDRVEVYENQKLVDTKVNLTGLPIWYSAMDKSRYDKFGDPFILDLIPLMDTIENLLSKLDDAVTTLSLNPLGVVSGQRIDSTIPNNLVGAVLNLEDGSDFKYASADMDRDSIKLELDYIIQQFYAVACVPSSILGQSNVSNVSETSITMLYQQTDNFCKQYIASMQEGFAKRLEYIRKLLEIKGITITDEVFDSISVSFNVNRPVDNKSDMENMKMQHECGAMSKQTIIDRSPYTTDTSLEMERIEAERIKEEQNASGDTLETNRTDADSNNNYRLENNIDGKVD